MTDNHRSGVAIQCAATIFLSAFLLFQVQPIISKMILPWFGGSPAVWSTCMLFFQVLLLGGYGYAHFIQGLPVLQQSRVHVALLLLSLFLLPITPSDIWKPAGGENPTNKILFLLAANVGLPYFLLSTTGPLVQAWFNRACPDRSVYRLYSLSNVGSLGALLSYPFFFEPRWSTPSQGTLWSWAYAAFVLTCGGLAWRIRGVQSLVPAAAASSSTKASPVAKGNAGADASTGEPLADSKSLADSEPTLWNRLVWVILPAIASMTLLAVTNHLCQDVAVVPFMWVAPLSLYLLTFIICFDNPRWYLRGTVAVLAAAVLVLISLEMMVWPLTRAISADYWGWGWVPDWIGTWLINQEIVSQQEAPAWVAGPIGKFFGWFRLQNWHEQIIRHASLYLAGMFLTCMICHGELARSKPAPRYLTSYFLMISAGGALGGIFVAMVCPTVLSSFLELNLTIGIGYLLATIVLVMMLGKWTLAALQSRRWLVPALCGAGTLTVLGGFGIVLSSQYASQDRDDIARMRSFYGVLHVEEGSMNAFDELDEGMVEYRDLQNGRILHGRQFFSDERSRVPTTYFGAHSGVGVLMNNFPRREKLRVGIVGLGTGTMAAYGDFEDFFRFYEINPQVRKIAEEYFAFLKECPAEVEVMMGDARLSMESHREPQNYDIIVLDAFSGDAIPVHLLTKESVQLYLKHLKPDGAIAVHISNLHLELDGVVAKIAENLGLRAIQISGIPDNPNIEFTSDWVILTNNTTFLNDAKVRAVSQHIHSTKRKEAQLWTDQYSNLLAILRSGRVLPQETYVEGICEDPMGTPVAGAKVEVTRIARDAAENAKPEPVVTLSTDKDGRFDLELLDASHDAWEYSVRVSSSQHVSGTYTLDEQIRMDRFLRAILPPL